MGRDGEKNTKSNDPIILVASNLGVNDPTALPCHPGYNDEPTGRETGVSFQRSTGFFSEVVQ